MNILIANSEQQQTDSLIDIIQQHDSEINILGNTTSAQETINFLNQNALDVDIAFLESQLVPDSSFELLKQSSASSQLVLTSKVKKDAYKAIKANSLDFLLQPFRPDEVSSAIYKAKTQLSSIRNEQRGFKKRFLIKVGDRIIFKTTDDISYIFADGKMAYIVTDNIKRKYIIEYTLDELEKKFLDPSNFYRINRKFIVNINAIEEARNYVNSRLKLVLTTPTDFDLIVSREKVSEFKEWLNL